MRHRVPLALRSSVHEPWELARTVGSRHWRGTVYMMRGRVKIL